MTVGSWLFPPKAVHDPATGMVVEGIDYRVIRALVDQIGHGTVVSMHYVANPADYLNTPNVSLKVKMVKWRCPSRILTSSMVVLPWSA